MSIKIVDLQNDAKSKSIILAVFKRVLSSGNFILGKEVKHFEEDFAEYLGVKFCIGVGNGLEALQIALMSLDIGKGMEVITTPISAVATTLAILATGAKPIFVDTTKNGLLNPNQILKVITKRTRAILPVHLYGQSADLNKLMTICQKHQLFLIEDAAQAHGSKFNGKYLGTFGKLGCFSFYPTKNLGALGDGGAIVTNDKKLALVCRQIRDYGQSEKYRHTRYGLNSRLDELQAALLRIKLPDLDRNNNKRKKLAQRYIKNLSKISGLEIVGSDNFANSNQHLFVIKVKQRDKLMKYLEKSGIQTLVHYPEIIPDQPFLKKEYGSLSLPIAKEFVNLCLSLPLHQKITFSDIDYISSQIIGFYKI